MPHACLSSQGRRFWSHWCWYRWVANTGRLMCGFSSADQLTCRALCSASAQKPENATSGKKSNFFKNKKQVGWIRHWMATMKYSDFVFVNLRWSQSVCVFGGREGEFSSTWLLLNTNLRFLNMQGHTNLRVFHGCTHDILHNHKVLTANPPETTYMYDGRSEFGIFLLPGRCLLRWSVGDKTPPRQRAAQWAGSPSGTEASCPPGDQRWAADWQKPRRCGTAVPGEWWVCDGRFWWWLECRW